MGYGDNEPPAIRADAVPATLSHPSGFAMLFLTFVKWDVIKLFWSTPTPGQVEFDSTGVSTDYFFQPTESDALYSFTAQGCSKAPDGSTGFCSPMSLPLSKRAAHNTSSIKQFLMISGIKLGQPISLRELLGAGEFPIRLRLVMGL